MRVHFLHCEVVGDVIAAVVVSAAAASDGTATTRYPSFVSDTQRWIEDTGEGMTAMMMDL